VLGRRSRLGRAVAAWSGGAVSVSGGGDGDDGDGDGAWSGGGSASVSVSVSDVVAVVSSTTAPRCPGSVHGGRILRGGMSRVLRVHRESGFVEDCDSEHGGLVDETWRAV